MEKNTGVRKHQARNSEPLNAICSEGLGSTPCYRLTFADEATSVDWNFSGCCGCFGNQGQVLTMLYAVFAAVFAGENITYNPGSALWGNQRSAFA